MFVNQHEQSRRLTAIGDEVFLSNTLLHLPWNFWVTLCCVLLFECGWSSGLKCIIVVGDVLFFPEAHFGLKSIIVVSAISLSFHLFIYPSWNIMYLIHIDGLVQKKCSSIVNAMEVHLSCTYPSMLAAVIGSPMRLNPADYVFATTIFPYSLIFFQFVLNNVFLSFHKKVSFLVIKNWY